MIVVKKITGEEIVINADLVQMIEFTRHAVMSLTTGEKVVVDETREDILRKVIEYKRAIFRRSEVMSWI